MNFGQLIECENMRNTFVDKSYINHTQLRTIAFTLFKAFLKKTKRGLELSPYLIFCMIFEEKYFSCFSCYVLLTDRISLFGCL